MALALPQTSERLSRDLRQWRVRDKLFVWERRFAARTSMRSGTTLPVVRSSEPG